MNKFRKEIKPPVKEGDVLDVRIESVGEKGDGITKIDGFILFVSNTCEGERVKIKVTKIVKKVGFAEVVERLSPNIESTSDESDFGEGDSDEEDVESFGDLMSEK